MKNVPHYEVKKCDRKLGIEFYEPSVNPSSTYAPMEAHLAIFNMQKLKTISQISGTKQMSCQSTPDAAFEHVTLAYWPF